jgi:hypothetical protein
MRAFVRVLPLLVAAAHVAACAANNVGGNPGSSTRASAAAGPAQPAKKIARERPAQALSARRPSPQCERSTPLEGISPDQARVAMLDYEQQCYRQLVQIEHARLTALQDTAAKTRSFGPEHRALLERQPPTGCAPAEPAAGLSPAEAREAMLDAQRQCYKQLAASEGQKADALQDALRTTAQKARGRGGETRRVPREPYMTY